MGYNHSHLTKLSKLIANEEIAPKPAIFDLGAQDLHYADRAMALDALQKLAASLGKEADSAARLLTEAPGRVSIHLLMKELGLRYATTDIEPRPGAIAVDLNQITPNSVIGNSFSSFDVVTNFGTTEHIANQLYSFKLLHDLVGVGGLIWNHVPIFGWLNHGYVNLTPKFWVGWIAHNGYEIVESRIDLNGTVVADDPTQFNKSLEKIGSFPLEKILNANIYLIVRKKSPTLFIPPLDIAWSRLAASDTRRIYSDALRSLYPDALDKEFENTLEIFFSRRGV